MTTPKFSDNPAAEQRQPARGTCPECWGTVALTPGGLIDRHKVRVISHGVETDSQQACIGRGRLPEQVA